MVPSVFSGTLIASTSVLITGTLSFSLRTVTDKLKASESLTPSEAMMASS